MALIIEIMLMGGLMRGLRIGVYAPRTYAAGVSDGFIHSFVVEP